MGTLVIVNDMHEVLEHGVTSIKEPPTLGKILTKEPCLN